MRDQIRGSVRSRPFARRLTITQVIFFPSSIFVSGNTLQTPFHYRYASKLSFLTQTAQYLFGDVLRT